MRVSAHYQDILAPHHFKREPGFPFWTLSILMAGPAHIAHGAESSLLTPGMLSLIRPGTPYRVDVAGRTRHAEYYAIFLMPSHLKMWKPWPELLSGWMGIKVQGTPVWKQALDAFKTACTHSAMGEPGEDLVLNAIERILLLAESINPVGAGAVLDERIELALAFARAHLADKLDVAVLAKAARLSPSRLAHLFVSQMSESPMRHVEGLRMRRAQELLLSTRMRVREIAATVGYDNPYHFSDRFRARIGRSPRAFRQRPL